MLTDISEGMLRDARRAIGDGDEFSFRECFCEALPFADESFDLVLANHVLFYCSDVEQACREAARVLKPGGQMCIRDSYGRVYSTSFYVRLHIFILPFFCVFANRRHVFLCFD